jgi:hypothetical protein
MSRKRKLSMHQRRRYSQMSNTNLLQYLDSLLVNRTKHLILGLPPVEFKAARLKFILELCAVRQLNPNHRTEETKKCAQHKSPKP